LKKFAFSLETLLQYRNNIEERERLALTRLNFRLQNEIAQRERLQALIRETIAELRRRRNGAADEIELQSYYPYIERLRLAVAESDKDIARLEELVVAQKKMLIEAARNTKILDTLKSKKLKEFTTAIERLEQKAVDEMVVTRFARKES
jgi:flagellar protein FliJ